MLPPYRLVFKVEGHFFLFNSFSMLGNFAINFFVFCWFSKITYFFKILTIRVSNGFNLDQARHFVGPDWVQTVCKGFSRQLLSSLSGKKLNSCYILYFQMKMVFWLSRERNRTTWRKLYLTSKQLLIYLNSCRRPRNTPLPVNVAIRQHTRMSGEITMTQVGAQGLLCRQFLSRKFLRVHVPILTPRRRYRDGTCQCIQTMSAQGVTRKNISILQ